MWKNGSCQKIEWGTCTGLAQNCSFGDILNLDGTCTYGLEKGKIAIGIVVYKSGNCGQAIGLGFSTMDARWYAANPPLDIPELPNYATEEEAFNDFNSCANTKILISDEVNTFKGKPSNIVEVALSVKTYNEGFVSDTAGYGSERIYIPELKGKWCVPAAGILKIVFDRKTEIDAIEKRIPNVSTDDKGILSHPVGNPYFDYGYASSTEIDDKTIWSMIATSSMLPDGFMKGSKTAFYAVRPVIEF